jgi:L-alanine-DL-glutamate epimerase-like enolase superfamily enzyme
MTEVLGRVRDAVGPDYTLMVDVQYAFPDADSCLKVIRDWVDLRLFFIETPVPSDDLAACARVATEQPIPIAAGEWLATRFEFLDLMDRGKVQVVQPDIGRVGGLTEAKRVCDLARERGLTVVPHLWKTGISIAAAAHIAAATPHCAFIEFLPARLCKSALRKELVTDELRMENGVIPLPSRPGLGVELNREALAHFKRAADRLAPQLLSL